MPITLLNSLPLKVVLIGPIIGMPPATAASYKTVTLFSFAREKISSPNFANNSLLAVTMCFLFLIAVFKTSKQGSTPPATSTTTSISGSFAISKGSSVIYWTLTSLFLFLFLTAAFKIFIFSNLDKALTTPVPTTPSPIIPIFKTFFSINWIIQ